MKELKAEIRSKCLAARQSLDPEYRLQADFRICMNLEDIEDADAKLIGAYISDGTEPDIRPFLDRMLKRGSRVCLPRYNKEKNSYEMAEVEEISGRTLVKGAYGIPEPDAHFKTLHEDSFKEMLWLVPGVAFDLSGARLGRGKGVYDRLMSEGRSRLKAGIFYECQQCASVPMDKHDCPMDMIITEEKIIRCA